MSVELLATFLTAAGVVGLFVSLAVAVAGSVWRQHRRVEDAVVLCLAEKRRYSHLLRDDISGGGSGSPSGAA